MWGPKSEPIFRGLPEHKGEGQMCFKPPENNDYPFWKDCPFFNFGIEGTWRMRVRAPGRDAVINRHVC